MTFVSMLQALTHYHQNLTSHSQYQVTLTAQSHFTKPLNSEVGDNYFQKTALIEY